MSCSCIPPPASLQPRKVYNILVPGVFPLKPPDPHADLPRGVERKVDKVAEYLQKQPARAGKVRWAGVVHGRFQPKRRRVDVATPET
jgi:hypothetical protein